MLFIIFAYKMKINILFVAIHAKINNLILKTYLVKSFFNFFVSLQIEFFLNEKNTF